MKCYICISRVFWAICWLLQSSTQVSGFSWAIIGVILILLSSLIFTAIASFPEREVKVVAVIAYPISFTLNCILHVGHLRWGLKTIHFLNSIDFKFVNIITDSFIFSFFNASNIPIFYLFYLLLSICNPFLFNKS